MELVSAVQMYERTLSVECRNHACSAHGFDMPDVQLLLTSQYTVLDTNL